MCAPGRLLKKEPTQLPRNKHACFCVYSRRETCLPPCPSTFGRVRGPYSSKLPSPLSLSLSLSLSQRQFHPCSAHYNMAQNKEQEKVDCRPHSDAPLPCVNNCGFFGCPSTMHLCSKCYKDVHVNVEGKHVPAKSSVDQNAMALSALGNTVMVKGEDDDALSGFSGMTSVSSGPLTIQNEPVVLAGSPSISPPSAIQQVVRTGSTRCISCRKRVGLLGFSCKCGGVFCSVHRYSDKHSCTFDYKAAGRDAIAKANPLVKAEKIEII